MMVFPKFKNFLKLKQNKPHLLIAGVDLKFISPAIKYLEKYYEVKVDEWGWDVNREVSRKSRDLLKWADIIFCEWMEYYAPWYSQNVSPNQKLFIRAHKYEITLDYGHLINFDNVCGVITINYFLLEIFSNVFTIPREKMFILNNIVETSIYSNIKDAEYTKHIALVGYAPSYKGYFRALTILNKLKKHDDFKLYLYGKDYTQMHWRNDPSQVEYFEMCEDFAKKNDLESSIICEGWVERKNMFKNIGYVLSLSDLEGSHLSPTEAFADSTISLLIDWPGVEYVYPKELIFRNMDDIVRYILDSYSDEKKYENTASRLKNYCVSEFGEEYFVDGIMKIFSTNNTSGCNTITRFKGHDFSDAVLIHEEDEIPEIINDNKNKSLLLSRDIDNHKIKNIYQKFSSSNINIYSQNFYDNIDDAFKFIELCNKYHKSNVSLN